MLKARERCAEIYRLAWKQLMWARSFFLHGRLALALDKSRQDRSQITDELVLEWRQIAPGIIDVVLIRALLTVSLR